MSVVSEKTTIKNKVSKSNRLMFQLHYLSCLVRKEPCNRNGSKVTLKTSHFFELIRFPIKQKKMYLKSDYLHATKTNVSMLTELCQNSVLLFYFFQTIYLYNCNGLISFNMLFICAYLLLVIRQYLVQILDSFLSAYFSLNVN